MNQLQLIVYRKPLMTLMLRRQTLLKIVYTDKRKKKIHIDVKLIHSSLQRNLKYFKIKKKGH